MHYLEHALISTAGFYTPPDCKFNAVAINWNVTSKGRQYDRLALMFLGDIEVWRTSTAEPTTAGIDFTYVKDMTQYLSLWKEEQKIIFDLGNIVNDVYTGWFNTTLTATFTYIEDAPKAADLILPISAESSASNSSSAWNIPSSNASVVQSFPPGVSRAIVSFAACGQSTEEFWYTNALNSDVDTYYDEYGALYGDSPFREIQLLIDGNLAGVAWPFPIIFTGGIAPGFWRPIVGIDAYDLREPEVDITPFLSLLNDGNAHTFEIKVRGLDDQGNGTATLTETPGSYWVVTGKIFLFTDSNSTTNDTASIPEITTSPDFSTTSVVTTNANGTNDTLYYTVSASRDLTISSSYGTWSQSLSYYNKGYAYNSGYTQWNEQSTKGTNTISIGSDEATVEFSYPLFVNNTYAITDTSLGIWAQMSRGLEITTTASDESLLDYPSVYSLVGGPMSLDTQQEGTATYFSSTTATSYSNGTTSQTFTQTDDKGTYSRDVEASNASIVYDRVEFNGASHSPAHAKLNVLVEQAVAGGRANVRAMTGRGPGEPNDGFFGLGS